MTEPWIFSAEPTVTSLTSGSVTLVEGTSFSISSSGGDIEPGGAHGLYFEDTRFVSSWRVLLDGAPLQTLAVIPRHPFAATFVSRSRPRLGESDSTLFVERNRYVGNGMREDLVVRNFGREVAACSFSCELAADFAHLFDVKESRVRPDGVHALEADPSSPSLSFESRDRSRRLDVVLPPGSHAVPGLGGWDVVVAAGGEWRASLEFRLTVDGRPVDLRYGRGVPVEQSVPAARLRAWEDTAPRIKTADEWVNATFVQSQQDLGALRIFDPQHPERAVSAAGAPWYMTLFGRDSLLTSLMTLEVDPSLAASTLLTLARLQGSKVDEVTEEQPGRILHEVRRGLTTAPTENAPHLLRLDRRDPSSSSSSGSFTAGEQTPAFSSSCFPMRTGPLPGSTSSATGTATASWSTSGQPSGGSPTRVGRTPTAR